MHSVHFSNKTDDWYTPEDFFKKIEEEYGPFDLDPCASAENAKAPRFYTKDDDGLTKTWNGSVYMNPPYGRTISLWMKKASEAAEQGSKVVCLVPARTDTKWWHDYAMKGEITFIKGRLKFGGSKINAPFPSALVVFNPKEGI